MISKRRARICLSIIAIVAAAAAIDAAMGQIWDQFAALCIVVFFSVIALLPQRSSRREVWIRADLARWLRDRAAVQGESMGSVADRGLATYRDHLVAENEPAP